MKRLILASSSPRRFELLNTTGLLFEVARPDIDETPLPLEAPQDYVQRLSLNKATEIARLIRANASNPGFLDTLVLSADTTVVDQDQILGKPENEHQAIEMLQQLRNRSHSVYTGITVYDVSTNNHATRLVSTQVRMRDYSDAEIAAYVASGDPLDKAGGYAIQNAQFHPVAEISGCYTNVVGLPVCIVCQLLASYMTVPHAPTCSPNSDRLKSAVCEFNPNTPKAS